MQIFLNFPALIWLMALAVIPLLVHLFAKSRPPEHAFSDLSFLKKIMKKTNRYRKPKDRMVLILRTLAAAALLFAFLHPLLVSKDPNDIVGADDNVIFIIDQSASMSAQEGSTTRFSEACNEASILMDEMNPDQSNIIWMKSTPEAVFPAPGPNLGYLKEKLLQAEPTMQSGAVAQSISLALDQLNKVKGNREIIVISDFQKQAWQDVKLFIPESIKLTKLAIGDSNLPNVAIDNLTVVPASPVSGQTVVISARVQNYSETSKSTTVYLNAGGGRQSRTVEIPPNGQSEVEFSTLFNNHGDVAVTASLGEGSFVGDDERYTIIPVRETLKLMSYRKGEQSTSDIVLSRLANALPWLSHVSVSELPTTGVCDVLFIHDWDGSDSDALDRLYNKGTSVIISPSNQSSMESLQAFLDLEQVTTKLSVKENSEGWNAQMAKESSAVFSIFKSGEFGNPAQGSFRRRFLLPKQWGNKSIINYTDDIPAILVSKSPTASRLIWNLSFDPEYSDWISQEPFVSFMAELLLNIQPSDGSNKAEVLAGSHVSWIIPDNIDASTLKLVLKSDAEAIQETELVNTVQGETIQSVSDAGPGVYEWRTGDTVAHANFVNFPLNESNLSLMNAGDVKSGDAADKQEIVRAEALSQGVSMWPWLLGAVFLLLIAESFAANTRKEHLNSDKT